MELGLKINDVEHLFMGLLAISMSSWKNNLLRSSGHFFLVELNIFSFISDVEAETPILWPPPGKS